MKCAALFIFVAATSIAAPIEKLASPSGRYVATADVPDAKEESASFRFRVRLWIEDVERRKTTKLYTGVDGDRWAIAWSSKSVLVIYTPDRDEDSRPWAFEIGDDGSISMRDPTANEFRIGERTFEEKNQTRPNQPPQRNAGSRPSSDDSPASETPSSRGPRG